MVTELKEKAIPYKLTSWKISGILCSKSSGPQIFPCQTRVFKAVMRNMTFHTQKVYSQNSKCPLPTLEDPSSHSIYPHALMQDPTLHSYPLALMPDLFYSIFKVFLNFNKELPQKRDFSICKRGFTNEMIWKVLFEFPI